MKKTEQSRRVVINKLFGLFLTFVIVSFLLSYILFLFPARPKKIIQINPSETSKIERTNFDLYSIRMEIFKINKEQKIYNNNAFGVIGNDTLVIVIQVHNRLNYLKKLIKSLRKAQGICNVFLIFSHDFFSSEINSLVRGINFCKVLQIFYPYSLQVFPYVPTPGKACPENGTTRTNGTGCLQKKRDPKLVQLKHHWWWKANRVFSLSLLRNYDGPVLFLEEDLYLVEDFIPTLRLLYRTMHKECEYCKFMSLALNEDAVNILTSDFSRSNEVDVTTQFSNMGLAFDRATWNEILKCSDVFCKFNDYNWDFSLQHVFTSCMQDSAAVTLDSPRVFHLGVCGAHFNTSNCDPSYKIAQIRQVLSRNIRSLYPDELTFFFNEDHQHSDVSYGGWEDASDRNLCISNTIK